MEGADVPITKPTTGASGWGSATSAAIGAINAHNTIWSAEPPPGSLSPLPTSNTADATAIVQAHLDAVSAAGGGRVVVEKPGQSVRFLTGLTVPSKVQLSSDENTVLDFSQVTSGACITVADQQNCTPLVGLRMDGSMFTPSSGDLSSTYTGIKITGRGLVFDALHLQYFGRAIDIAQSSTYGVTFRDSTIDHCANGLYADLETSGASNSGEKIVWSGGSIANSVLGFNASAGGMHIRFQDASIDFCTTFGRVSNARLYYSGHLERSGGTTSTYLFDVVGNSRVHMSDTEIIMGSGQLFNTAATGPSNYGFGEARFSNVSAFFTDPASASQNVDSDYMISWPTSTTTGSVYVPFPLKWCAVSAAFCVTDSYTAPNTDAVQITGMTPATGQISLTTPAYAGQRWIRLRFG